MKKLRLLLILLCLSPALFAQEEFNPMGKTWVVFIENTDYESFASLTGPTTDIELMKSSLQGYLIDRIIHVKNMTKQEMEDFFAKEFRNLVVENEVNAIMVWYAGHGKFINNIGYWIPVDATLDDEFTYYNMNSLRQSLREYSESVTNTLVVTDACESGPTFYQAMRSIPTNRSCSELMSGPARSSQVLTSSGYEFATENSAFTNTFASALANNANPCLPIENIVTQVTIAASRNNQARPRFGKIAGLEDEGGTFFFVAREQ
ncbi:MAG: caspase family protein [Marinilabiliales bacterium]|nr:MAG: caspase family protein [Marinilabiliales bacterium]